MVKLENVLHNGRLYHIQLHFAMDRLQLVIALGNGNANNVTLRMVAHVVVDQLVMRAHLEIVIVLEIANVRKCILREQ